MTQRDRGEITVTTRLTNPAFQDGKTAGLSELSRRALALYHEKLRAILEPEHNGRGLAIHPDTGDYLVAKTPTHAGRATDERHPEGGSVTMRIGSQPDYALASRILTGQMMDTQDETPEHER